MGTRLPSAFFQARQKMGTGFFKYSARPLWSVKDVHIGAALEPALAHGVSRINARYAGI